MARASCARPCMRPRAFLNLYPKRLATHRATTSAHAHANHDIFTNRSLIQRQRQDGKDPSSREVKRGALDREGSSSVQTELTGQIRAFRVRREGAVVPGAPRSPLLPLGVKTDLCYTARYTGSNGYTSPTHCPAAAV